MMEATQTHAMERPKLMGAPGVSSDLDVLAEALGYLEDSIDRLYNKSAPFLLPMDQPGVPDTEPSRLACPVGIRAQTAIDRLRSQTRRLLLLVDLLDA